MISTDINSVVSVPTSIEDDMAVISQFDDDSLSRELLLCFSGNRNFQYEKVKQIIDILESRNVPIQTSSFMAFAIQGRWNHIYSNFPLPRKDLTL